MSDTACQTDLLKCALSGEEGASFCACQLLATADNFLVDPHGFDSYPCLSAAGIDVTFLGEDQARRIEEATRQVLRRLAQNGRVKEFPAPASISGRHVHLCQADMDVLFGKGYEFQVLKELYQTEQYAYQERVLVVGRKRCAEEVRILGPARPKSQCELSQTDAILLGLVLPIAMSGTDPASQPITLVGPKGMVTLPGGTGGGAYIARRHLHINTAEAEAYGIKTGDVVSARVDGPRSMTLHEILVRTDPTFRCELHLDTDEGNAAGIRSGQLVGIVIPDR